MYKYVTLRTARAILSSQTFRYSSPLRFNDPFDIQTECVAEKPPSFASKAFTDRVDELVLSRAPLDNIRQPWRQFIQQLQELSEIYGYKKDEINRRLAQLLDEKRSVESIEYEMGKGTVWLQMEMKRLRVFCASEAPDILLMWSHYAENHTGVVFEISAVQDPEEEGFALRKVTYVDTPHVMITMKGIVDLALCSDITIDDITKYDDFIFKKCDIWSYERELRVVRRVPHDSEHDYLDVPITQPEVTRIIFGCMTPDADIREISSLAMELSPSIELWRAKKSRTRYALSFEKL